MQSAELRALAFYRNLANPFLDTEPMYHGTKNQISEHSVLFFFGLRL